MFFETMDVLETSEPMEPMMPMEQLESFNEVTDHSSDATNVTGEMYQMEGIGDVIVTGKPFENLDQLDYSQGDNSYGALGCCGLVSSSNFLNLCGLETTEEQMVGFAMENGLCSDGFFMPPECRGGANDPQIESILESHGIDVSVYNATEGGSVEDIANAIDEGRMVTIGVNAGYLWGSADCVDAGQANHQITVTGAVRDTSGELVGLVICDSGRGLESDACRVVSVSELELCYGTVAGATAIITDAPVRN